MNNIYTSFPIKDLENLTGVKAHTIRVWEQRYHILTPERTASNIRYYDIQNLKKLLNVVLLNNAGYKISYISTLTESELTIHVHDLISKDEKMEHALNAFKLSMLSFNRIHFNSIYTNLLEKNTFRSIFTEIFIPLLNAIGLLWQSDAVTPAHEHFISYLIQQKLLVNIERVQHTNQAESDRTYILFLPENEIHELGLLYLHYELLLRGFNSIYLGQSIPVDSLLVFEQKNTDLVFVSYFTIKPEREELQNYLKTIDKNILNSPGRNYSLVLLGRRLADADPSFFSEKMSIYRSIPDFLEKL